jgi:type I restriction enzyme, S subunit
MSFPRYDNYRDSGVEWLGEVPGHWGVVPLFAIAKECDRPNFGMIENNLLSLSYGKIIRKNIDDNDGLLPASFETYQIAEPNEIVWRLTDLQNDQRSLRTAITTERGIITSAYLLTRIEGAIPVYFAHLLRGYDQRKIFYSMGGGLRQGMKFSDVKRMPIPLPTPEEQTAIAEFLDRETGKIDGLIEEQRRLVVLLKEKRQAVISHAVTKGLNPTAPLKPSGIEWLGDVPAHWGVVRVKFIAEKISKGTTPTTENSDFALDGIRFLKAENIQNNEVNSVPEFFISEQTHQQLERSQLKESDVLVVIAGATTGKSAVMPRRFLPCNTNQAVCFVRPIDPTTATFLNRTGFAGG